jgi:argininosuccinate synthase
MSTLWFWQPLNSISNSWCWENKRSWTRFSNIQEAKDRIDMSKMYNNDKNVILLNIHSENEELRKRVQEKMREIEVKMKKKQNKKEKIKITYY